LGNCVLNGLNTTLTTTQANFGSIVLGGTATSLLKSNGSSLSGTGVVKGDTTVLSGTVNQVVLGNGTLTVSNANSIMKGDATTLAGTASQYVMGNGSLLTATYPTFTSITGNATYNGVNIAYRARRIGITGSGTVTLHILGWSASVATTVSSLNSNSFLPVDYRPLNAIFVPCRITKAGVLSLGLLIVYLSGEIGITDISQTAGFWVAGTTNCGILQDMTVSFCTL
jgi:hypothetical protein